MRLRLLPVALFAFLPLVLFGQLAELDPNGEVDDFEEQLESYMTSTKNERARSAYANFTGVFYGGSFSPEQQQQIATTSIALAGIRASAAGAMADYLELHEYLGGSDESQMRLFNEFHSTINQLLANPKIRVNTVSQVLATSLSFMKSRRLDNRQGEYGWLVVGGAPHFEYRDSAMLRIDTVRQLLAVGKDDTLTIQETEVMLNLASGNGRGRGGRTDWQRVSLPEEVFAIVVSYSFDTRRMRYFADSAHLQYPEYFGDKILVGQYADQLQAGGARTGANYPQFISNDGFVEIKNVGEGIDLFGNFELRGGNVYAIGEREREAEVTLDIKDGDDGRAVRGRAQSFTVKQGERVSGQRVETTIYFQEDSLYHPSVTIDVNIPNREVELTRTKSSSDRAPFYHSANRVNIYADNINIYLEQDSAVVGKRSVSFQEKDDVVLESEEYYSEREFIQVQSLGRYNPLEIIYGYRMGPEGGNDIIDAEALARRFGQGNTAKDIEPLLFELQDRGFLAYDSEKKRIYLTSKLKHYVESNREQKDYDHMRILSRTPKINAFIDLKKGTIRMDAVRPVEFNHDKQIAIKPIGGQLAISGNRNLEFSGDVYAGGAVLSGKTFNFQYDPYYISFDSVRYVDLFLPENDKIEEGMRRLSAGSRIEHVTGYLLIDAPKNKSGTENISYFPSLESKEMSYIYYDKADTLATYRRDSFYFELQPFSLSGLDSLVKEDIAMDGKLFSGGIFPDIEETLSIQEDGSLGFITETPEEGQSTYGERGRYQGEIMLSNQGLEGKGTLTYLEAEIESEDLRFEMDKTTASARQFNLEESITEGREIPQVRGTEINITFKPYTDSLAVESVQGAPFDLFKSGEHTFDGSLVLTPEALKGDGKLDWSRANMSSHDMDFGSFEASADTADVQIKSLEADNRIALSTTNVKAKVDFTKQVGAFENNSDELSTALPYNQFKTSIDRFDWDMAGGNVTFQAQPGKNRFTSTHPDQDELTFTGTDAIYDINTSLLDVDGVPFILSADAKIFPGDGKIRVEPGAKITELTDARIVADTINEYHVINRATVNITGRKEYTASGFYEYNVGPHTQELELQNIIGTRVGAGKKSEKATATRAEGTVAQGTDFYIDDKTLFYGTINLDAGNKNLSFDGYAKIDSENLPTAEWFVVESEGDKKDLTLNIAGTKNREGIPMATGFYLSKPYRRIYPSLIQTLDRRDDHPILKADGVFNYNEEEDKFIFGDSTRVNNPEATKGNLMVYDQKANKLTADGMLGIGGRLKYVKMKSYGTVEMNLPPQVEREPRMVIAEEPEEEESKKSKKKKKESESESLLSDEMFILPSEEEEVAAENTDSTSADGLTIEGEINDPYPNTDVKIMTAIDLILPPKLIQLMGTDFASSAYGARELNIVSNLQFAQTGIETLFPPSKEREQAIAGLVSDAVDLPKKVNPHTFLFTDMKMRWSPDYQSFVSTEKTNGLATIAGVPISRKVESHVEVKMTAGGEDRLYIYVKSPSEIYYFFGFKDGIMNVVSNNSAFMSELQNMKAKDLVLKMEDGETYEILEVTPGTAQTFLRRAKAAFGSQR